MVCRMFVGVFSAVTATAFALAIDADEVAPAGMIALRVTAAAATVLNNAVRAKREPRPRRVVWFVTCMLNFLFLVVVGGL